MSETCPPLGISTGTTVPKVAPQAAAEHRTAARQKMPGERPKPDKRVLDSEIRVIQSLSGGLTQISRCEAQESPPGAAPRRPPGRFSTSQINYSVFLRRRSTIRPR